MKRNEWNGKKIPFKIFKTKTCKKKRAMSYSLYRRETRKINPSCFILSPSIFFLEFKKKDVC